MNKVDNMIIQAIALLDTLDKDVNTFVMRVREWCVSFLKPGVHSTASSGPMKRRSAASCQAAICGLCK